MKLIRKQSRKIALILALSFLFVSCSQYDDNSINNSNARDLNKALNTSNIKIAGEDLFKAIVFVDGKLTKQIPSLYSIANTDDLSDIKLIEYRNQEKEAMDYLKNLNVDYFKKFQEEIYTKDPEIISKSISKVIKDLVPYMNQKLAIQGLTVEKLTKTLKKDNGIIDVKNILSKKNQEVACAVWVLAIGVVLVAAVVFYVVAVSEVAMGLSKVEDVPVTLEAISIQIAEAL